MTITQYAIRASKSIGSRHLKSLGPDYDAGEAALLVPILPAVFIQVSIHVSYPPSISAVGFSGRNRRSIDLQMASPALDVPQRQA